MPLEEDDSRVENRSVIILITYIVTLLAITGYCFYLLKTIPESQSIAILFVGPYYLSIAFLIETIFFAIIFYKSWKDLYGGLLAVFILSSLMPLYFVKIWYSDLPVENSASGKEHKKLDRAWLELDNYTYAITFRDNNLNPQSPPPFKEQIAPFCFLLNGNKLFFYALPIQPLLCGYMMADVSDSFEYYEPEFNKLKSSDLQLVSENNIDSIIQKNIMTVENKFRFVTIGIDSDETKNDLVLALIEQLNEPFAKISWKVRRIREKEKLLVEELKRN